jgi:hypothetical protein
LGSLPQWKCIVEDAKGASKELCTLWNKNDLTLVSSLQPHNWIKTKFRSMSNGKCYTLINIYMPAKPLENPDCWHSIQRQKYAANLSKCIIAGDFNTIRNNFEKRGGYYA